jgi:phosphate transport system substrate-binding protein
VKKAVLILAAAGALAAVGCGSATPQSGDSVVVVGSDTMLELNRRLAEDFMRGHPGVRIMVEGGGSGIGIDHLIEGTAEIAAASRPLSSAEVARLYASRETLGVRFLIAQDALSVSVNAANPVRDLSRDQLRGLFTGAITDWSSVGGEPGRVRVIVRPPSSGTQRFFRDHVLTGEAYASSATTKATTRGVLEAVAADRWAVGYGGVAYRVPGVVQVAVDGVEPTTENVGRGRYPLSRYLVFYTAAPPTGLARVFIDWCVGASGQRVVAAVGYVPLWAPGG